MDQQQITADEQDSGGAAMPEASVADRMEVIEAFAGIVRDKRTAAIDGRAQSGIERIWEEDEAHYEGEDSNTRSGWEKGRTTTDTPRQRTAEDRVGSTVFVNMTAPYCDAAAARVSDMLLPTDDRNFAVRPGPVPDMVQPGVAQAGQQPGMAPLAVQPAQPKPGMLAGLMSRMFSPQQQAQAPQLVENQVAKAAKTACDRAQDVIDDWLVECRYHAEVRTVIENAARVGCGILKGPIPSVTKSRAAVHGPGGWSVQIKQEIKPKSKAVNHWNFYPDPNCGEDIQNGSYTLECDDITARRLIELKADDTYITEMIDLCIEEGPSNIEDGTRKKKPGEKTQPGDLFQIWYFYGQVSRKEMEAAGCECPEGKDLFPAIVTMVNDHVIKITMSPLDSGEFPYDVMVWKRKIGHWAGVGVARQMRTDQRGLNAAVRQMMDNAGLSTGPQIVVNRSKIVPANGRWEITPRKIWYTKEGEEVQDLKQAFQFATVPSVQIELMGIVQFWLKQAEDATGLPMLIQGQLGAKPTDKVGIAQIQNNNGSTVLRRIARIFDDRVTERHIGRYYEYLLMYGPDDAKGDFQIDARGSSALVERDIKNQALMQFVGLAPNGVYGLDPVKVAAEVLKGMRIDPQSVQYDDEQKAKMANQPPPEDPRVTAAKIMAKSRDDATVAQAQIRKHEIDTQDANDDLDRALEWRRAQIDAELTREGLTEKRRAQLEDHKVDLAGLALKLKVQQDMAVGSAAVDMHKFRNPQVIKPAAEPAQRAPDGQAFVQ